MSVAPLGTTPAEPADVARTLPAPAQREQWLTAAAFVLAGLALVAAYLRQAATVPATSDGAAQALQAWDVLHGNPLLRGWLLTDVPFYTTEVPQYVFVEWLRGLGAGTVYICAAMTYTLMLLFAALLAKGAATGREGLLRSLLTAGIMLAPSLGLATYALIDAPDHTGTQVPLLLTWLVLDRARPGWRPAVAVAVLLALAQTADPLALYEGSLPIVVVCLLRMHHRRGRLREHWYELSLIAATAASAVAATLAIRLIGALGGFTVTSPAATFASVADAVTSHVGITVESVLQLYGADFSGEPLGIRALIPLVHLVGVALAAWAFARALRHFFASDLVVQVLAVAAVVLLVAYMFRGNPSLIGSPHEIAGVLPIGAVLAGRLLPGTLSRARLIAPLALILACYAGFLVYDAAQPASQSSRVALVSWLEAHHLTYGLSDYWDANALTLYSGDRVEVRPPDRPGGSAAWLDPATHDARFYVFPSQCPYLSVTARGAWERKVEAAYGKPAASYTVAGYIVLVWDKNLLAGQLPPIPPTTNSCSQGPTAAPEFTRLAVSSAPIARARTARPGPSTRTSA
jgi:hypothetical protein